MSLFSGIGGLDLAAEWAGIETVGQCEWADYPYKVLCKHWPDVPKWRDIHELTKESFREQTGLQTVDVISGGFPCQPFSVAGKHRGTEDDRYLWPEMCRVIAELRPHYVLGENVAGIVNMALDTVLSDLEAQGYTARTFIIPACGIGAPHRRYRAAIVANTNSTGREEFGTAIIADKEEFDTRGSVAQLISNADGGGCRRKQRRQHARQFADGSWWATEPGVGRVANGIPHRVDRVKCLGNTVVPQQFYPIFKAIAAVEGGEEDGR